MSFTVSTRLAAVKTLTKVAPTSCRHIIASTSFLPSRRFGTDSSNNDISNMTKSDPTDSYASLIDILFREGHADKGRELLQQVQDHASGISSTSGAHAALTDTEINLETVINYNNAVISAVKVGNVQQAEKVLEEMKSKGFTPSCEAYNELTRYYASKERDWRRVYELVGEMSHCGITKDLHLFNVVIRGFVNNLDMVSANHSFNEMIAQKVEPNVVTFNTMIDGYCRKTWKAEAELWFKKMSEFNVKPNINTFNLLVELFSRLGDVGGALKYVNSMQAAKIKPDTRTWTALMDAYTRASHWSYAFSVWEDHLRPADTHPPGSVNAVSESALSTFLRLCGESGNAQRAIKEWNFLKNNRHLVRPSVANCNELMACFIKNGLLAEAKNVLFNEMRRGDDIVEYGTSMKPAATWKTYVQLLTALSKANRTRELEEVKVVMFAHDQQVVEAVMEELPHLFAMEEKLFTRKR